MGFLVALLAPRFGALVANLIVYGVLAAVIGGTLLGIRQHYVNEGWRKHKAAVERQDNIAIDASKKVEERTQRCSDENGFWDVITQNCKLQEEEKK
jgi:hypothetical protein